MSLRTSIRSFGAQRCEIYASGMRVCVTSEGLYTYPDIVIACGEPQFLDGEFDTLVNPTVIIEVLSPTTEAYDRGKKFALYRSLESLREYVLISVDRVQVERYCRQTGGHWLLTAVESLEGTIEFESAGCVLHLADLYERVEFESPALPLAPPVPERPV